MGQNTGDSNNRRVLISGGGIAGLSLGIQLHEKGWAPLIVERDPALRTEGYMMDLFGTGWDAAGRLGVLEAIRAVKYPIDYLRYVDSRGRPYASVPISRVRRSLGGNYAFFRRSDLESALFERAGSIGLGVRFGTAIRSLEDAGSRVDVDFEDGSRDSFSLVFGADGVHSRVRELTFGPEAQFARYLGSYVAAFHAAEKYGLDDSFKMFEETDRLAGFYPIGNRSMTSFYLFRSRDLGFVPHGERLPLLKKRYRGSGWIGERVLEDIAPETPVFFDSLTQIVMPAWSRGRVALLGDAAGCLTLVAGQGSHMAMSGAYIIARELERYQGEHELAFRAYEALLRPMVVSRQNSAARFSRMFLPSAGSRPWLRRSVMRLIFSRPLIGLVFSMFGSKSILKDYK